VIEIVNIKKIFPELSYEDLYEKESAYKQRFISIFDHWLLREEAEVCLIPSNQNIYKTKLLKLYEVFFDQKYTLYAYYDNNLVRKSEKLFRIKDKSHYMNLVVNSITEKCFLRLLIIELEIIIDGGYDYTLPMFLTKNVDMDNLEKIITKCDLFILH
jgi:hypothetical protein